jgi:hypothetical protein
MAAVATAAVFQERELGFENSKIGASMADGRMKKRGFFTIIIVKMWPTRPIRHDNQHNSLISTFLH